MKVMNFVTLINQAFRFVIQTSQEYCIDESHALKHSMEVFNFANNIYESELRSYPHLSDQREIISLAAIVHDMCDKKYMNETIGIINIKNYMKDYLPEEELEVVTSIISGMSYSTVKKKGYPDLGKYQHAYHIVREADLLAAYDFDRSVIFNIMRNKCNYVDSLYESKELFEKRILNYRKDKLFITNYSKNKSVLLHKKAISDIEKINALLKILQ
jgi:HD superfamily phosphodiesterase